MDHLEDPLEADEPQKDPSDGPWSGPSWSVWITHAADGLQWSRKWRKRGVYLRDSGDLALGWTFRPVSGPSQELMKNEKVNNSGFENLENVTFLLSAL